MSRLLLFLLTIVVVVLAVGYAVRSRRAPTVAIASLLPNGTIALAHVPDFEKTRDEWHRSDIYQLYLEPSVQEFLRKPLSHVPHSGAVAQRSRELEQLDPKDAFLALTSTENDQPTFVGGFRYRGSQSDAEKIIGEWKAKLLGTSGAGATTETVDYQKASIQVSRVASVTLCTTYEKQWFLAANRVEALEETIDRLRGTAKTNDNSLATDPSFRNAMGHMPADYIFGFYVQPKSFADKLANLRKSAGQPATPEQLEVFSKIKSFCGATRFDGGKLHDVFFVGTPELVSGGDLTRNSVALTTTDTFLYGATLLDLSRQFALADPSVNSSFLGERLRKIGAGLAAAGITPAEWQGVFGNEMGALADWRSDNRVPSPLVVFPVKDFAKAKRMAVSLAHILDDDGEWAESDKDGVHYISSPYRMGFLTLQPTIAVSERFLVAGVDLAALQAAFARVASGGPDVSSGADYKQAVKALPPPTRAFSYLDLALLYGRIDAAFRPMLLMGAAFMPAMNEYVDVGKVPTAETIAKHLKPIVSSQRYEKDGYVGESIGPITLSQAAIGVTGAVVAGAIGYRYQGQSLTPSLLGSPGGVASPSSAVGGRGGWTGKGFKVRNSPTPVPAGTP
jgi:hypothetical protein